MDFSALNYVDYTVFTIVIVSMLFACVRGFIGSFLSFIGWILAIYLSYALYPDVSPYIENKIKNPLFVIVIGHSGLLICFLILFGILNLFATNAVKNFTMGATDRLLGLGFGLVRGALIATFFYLIIFTTFNIIHGTKANQDTKSIDKNLPLWLTKAQTYPYLKQGKAILNEFIPDSFYQRIQVVYDDLSKKSMDERFTETMSQKLMDQLSPEQKKNIEESLDEAALSKSQKELDEIKIQKLLDEYKKGTNEKNQGTISEQEIQHLEEAINKQKSNDQINQNDQGDKKVELNIESEHTD